MNLFFRWLLASIAVAITAYLLPGVSADTVTVVVVTALVLGIINTFVKPLVILFTLPLNILTLGLFTLVINAFLVLLTARLVPGFEVANFWWAILFSLVLAIVNSFLSLMGAKR
ncbi:MAG TPA: phage holin family protein [Patescibacteria group bacterium]|nr:phage holin family protein [Patescibacteria group bacterium]